MTLDDDDVMVIAQMFRCEYKATVMYCHADYSRERHFDRRMENSGLNHDINAERLNGKQQHNMHVVRIQSMVKCKIT